MKKIYLASVLSFLLVSQPSIHAIPVAQCVATVYTLLLGSFIYRFLLKPPVIKKTTQLFDDPYNAPTQEEWDSFCKHNAGKALEQKNINTKEIKDMYNLQKNSCAKMTLIGMWENTRNKIHLERLKNNQ